MLKFKHRESLDSYFKNPEGWKKFNKKKIIKLAVIIIAAILVILLIWGIFSMVRNNSGSKEAKMIKMVSKHLLLPSEKPAVVDIKDSAELIKEQPFYQGTQDGDVLLIFTEAKKAIIYSPSRDIIVNVGPIYAGQEMEGLK